MKKYLRSSAMAILVLSALAAHATENRPDSLMHHRGENAQQGRGQGLSVVGLTEDMRLLRFNEKKPGDAHTIGKVTGMAAGDALIGIDYRVQDGKLYGVGKSGAVYILDTSSAAAAKVSHLTVPLDGATFGVDFNPAADRLRIVSDTGQNLRHNVNANGVTLVDDPLDYPPATPVNAVGPNATGVTGAAYTNNDLDPSTATTLYVLDSNLDQIALQSPPNDGTLAATGKLGMDAGAKVGFDIHSTLKDGVTKRIDGLATLQGTDGGTTLYSIDLATGKATSQGSFSSQDRVMAIAIPLQQ